MLKGLFRRSKRKNLYTPDRALIELTGYSAEQLRMALVVPERDSASLAGYCLIAADPETIDLDAFRAAGVEIRSGTRQEVESSWRNYRPGLPTSGIKDCSNHSPYSVKKTQFGPKIIKTLTRLASDAARLGAREVFIGYPAAEDFEFVGAESRFRGKVDSELGSEIARTLPRGSIFRTDTETANSPVSCLIVGCVRELNRPVVYLSWDGKYEFNQDNLEGERMSGSNPSDGRQVMMAFPRNCGIEENQRRERNIVLVDDDIRYLTIIGSVLRRRGWLVHEALKATIGLEIINNAEVEIDLVIADVRMPEMNGLEFLAELRRHAPDLPVLMLTSDDEPQVEIKAVEFGATCFVLKQKELDILIAWACRLLSEPFVPAFSDSMVVPPVQ